MKPQKNGDRAAPVRKPGSSWLYVLFGLLLFLGGPARGQPVVKSDVFSHIDRAYHRGELDWEERIYFKVAALKDPYLLPSTLRDILREGGPVGGSFTHVMVEAAQALPMMDPVMAEQMRQLLLPPPDLTYTMEVTNPFPIRVSYSAPSQQSMAQAILNAAVTSYQVEVQNWGFWEPAIESGAVYYRYYVDDTGMGGGAYTAPYDEVLSTPRYDFYTYVVVDPLNDIDYIGAIVAHEFNHACQAAMDGAETMAFWENTATYIMSQVFPDQFFYTMAFFPEFQGYPYRPLEYHGTGNGAYEYGGALWIIFLEQLYGNNDPTWIRSIWEGSVQNSWNNEPDYFDVLRDVLQPSGGFTEMVRTFAQHRYFVGSDDDGQHLDGASEWFSGEVYKEGNYTLSDLSVINASPSSTNRPQPNGCNYIQLRVTSQPMASIRFSVSGLTGATWNVDLMRIHQGNPTTFQRMTIDAQGEASEVVNPDMGDKLVMVVCQLTGSSYDPDDQNWTARSYSYSILYEVPAPTVTAVDPSQVAQGTEAALHVHGTGFQNGAGLSVQISGGGVTVGQPVFVSATELLVQINVAASAALGSRDVVVMNPDGQYATGVGLLTITQQVVQVDGSVQTDGASPMDGGAEADAGGGGSVKGGCDCRAGAAGSKSGRIAFWLLLLLTGICLVSRLRKQGLL